jgi:predicted RNase H-like HicB family nuclease
MGYPMHKYLVVFEKTPTGYSAYSPDLPGCVSTGRSRSDVEANMKEAIEFHLEGLKEEGWTIPEPSSESAYLEVAS